MSDTIISNVRELAIALFGVSVSVGAFLVIYRHTIGLRIKRIREANDEVRRALLRRVVVENAEPSEAALRLMLEGKALQVSIRTDQLSSPDEILVRLYSEVFEMETITPQQRGQIEKAIGRSIYEARRPEAKRVARAALPVRSRWGRFVPNSDNLVLVISVVLGITSSAVAGSILFDEAAFPSLVAVFVLSTVLIMTISVMRRLRETNSSTTSRPQGLTLEIRLAQRVERALRSENLEYSRMAQIGDCSIDFVAKHSGRTLVIEVDDNDLPSCVESLIARTGYVVRENGIEQGIIVLPSLPNASADDAEIDDPVSVVAIDDIRDALRRFKRQVAPRFREGSG